MSSALLALLLVLMGAAPSAGTNAATPPGPSAEKPVTGSPSPDPAVTPRAGGASTTTSTTETASPSAPVPPTPPAPASATAPSQPTSSPAPAGAPPSPSPSGNEPPPARSAEQRRPPAQSRAARQEKMEPAIPPALTASALREELRMNVQKRSEELAEIKATKEKLEKLLAEIATARAALAKETAQLEERLKKATPLARAGAARPAGPTQGDTNDQALAKALKGMRPDQAAVLVARLDRPLAVSLLRRMRPADVGAVLEKMKPETAAELVSMMASRRTPGGAQ